ncbi:hypothetical protein [Aquimarina pacifica]|uniref:hypothetical protein n=1 Tax=Aquimarina pacifica TaxID=1296415 RepID=UPI000472B0B5|nr:hypothetical protein [Aquimarina pacifica]
MGKGTKIYLTVLFILFLLFMAVVIQTFRPVRNVQPEDVLKITGTVIDINDAPGFDISFTLKDDLHYYYINRGLQYNLSADSLRSDLLDKKVTLYVIKRWTIFTRDKNMGHISKLMIDDRIIFNEINNDIHEQTIK